MTATDKPMTYRGYHVMQWAADRYSIYRCGNSIYSWDGFKSVNAAQAFIDKLAAE